MGVDVSGDDALIVLRQADELEAHADAAVAPRDLGRDVDILLAHRHAESRLDGGADLQRARRPHGNAAAADVQRDRCRDRVAEAISDGDAEHDARAGTAIEVAWKEMRRK